MPVPKIVSIIPAGKKAQRCITVAANDGLFVLGNNIVTHNSDDYIMRMFNDLKSRIESRMKDNYWGRSILDSSPNTLDSPIDEYIVNHARKDLTNFVVDGSIWKWAPEEYDLTKTFKVFVGGKGQPPRILDDGEVIPEEEQTSDKFIDVPTSMKQYFVDDLYKSLKDRAGIPAGSADNLIYDYTKIEDIFNPHLRNVYTHIKASVEMEPQKLIWNQISKLFFKTRAGQTEFWYKPYLPRAIAVDQSLSQDVSAIACVHLEKKQGSDELIYVVDFTIPIAPLGSRISLDAIKLFIEDLRNIGNMNISHISFDQFQSESSIQYLKARGFEVEKLSVDTTTDPYFHLISLIETKRLVIGRNVYFKNNLKSLKIVRKSSSDGRKKIHMKVDHEDSQLGITTGPEEWMKSKHGMYAKDVSDAVAGACELLRRYQPVAYELWDPTYVEQLVDGELERKSAQQRSLDFMNKMGVKV